MVVNETRLKLIKALPFKDKAGQENKQLFLQFFVNVIRVARVTETVRSIVDLLNTINLPLIHVTPSCHNDHSYT